MKKVYLYLVMFIYSLGMSWITQNESGYQFLVLNMILFLSTVIIYFYVIKFFTEVVESLLDDQSNSKYSQVLYMLFPVHLIIRYILLLLVESNYISSVELIYLYMVCNGVGVLLSVEYVRRASHITWIRGYSMGIPFIIYLILDGLSLQGAMM